MKIASSPFRAVALFTILGLMPASVAVAQAHKGKHHAAKAHVAQPAAAATPQKTMQQAGSMRNQSGVRNNANTASNPSNASLVSSLHSTITQLNQADHDYQGHKARAMHEIHTAINHLSSQGGQSNTGNTGLAHSGHRTHSGNVNGEGTANLKGTAASMGNGQKVPQATSDTYLREAQQSLQNIDSQMNTSGVNPHQFNQARTSIQGAIRELNLALIER